MVSLRAQPPRPRRARRRPRYPRHATVVVAALGLWGCSDGESDPARGGSSTTSSSTTTTSSYPTTSTYPSGTTTAPYTDGPCETRPCDMCVECAHEGPCAEWMELCRATAECMAFVECLGNDGHYCGEECLQACEEAYPEGMDLVTAYHQCVDCEVCVDSCLNHAECQ